MRTKSNAHKSLLFLLVVSEILAITLLTLCRTAITVSVEPTNPPSFRIDRHLSEVDELQLFIVVEVDAENLNLPFGQQNHQRNRILWKLVHKEGPTPSIGGSSPITYGKIPTGFIQEVPEQGPPPALSEGKVYEASGPLAMMPQGIVRFTIRDGKPVQMNP